MGSFFDLDLVEGSAEANPPFNEEAMTAMVDRIEYVKKKKKKTTLSRWHFNLLSLGKLSAAGKKCEPALVHRVCA